MSIYQIGETVLEDIRRYKQLRIKRVVFRDNVCTFYVCRVYEKIMEKMQEVGSTITGLKKRLSEWAKKKGLQGNQNIQKR